MSSGDLFRPQLEPLGSRVVPAIVLDNTGGELKIFGTAGNDIVTVQLVDANTLRVSINTTGEVRTFAVSQVNRIELKGGGGNDVLNVAAGITIPSEISGGRGRDTIRGGGADDSIDGGLGNDNINGRGGDDSCRGGSGSDVVNGGGGDDSCSGGDGDDSVNGGVGDDSCSGDGGDDSLNGGDGDDICDGGSGDDSSSDGFDTETELSATLSGTTGFGSAEFGFETSSDEVEREFEIEVEDLNVSNTNLDVFVNGVLVGALPVDGEGTGELKFEMDFDSDDDGSLDFPTGFPEVGVGTVVSVMSNGTLLLQGTFA